MRGRLNVRVQPSRILRNVGAREKVHTVVVRVRPLTAWTVCSVVRHQAVLHEQLLCGVDRVLRRRSVTQDFHILSVLRGSRRRVHCVEVPLSGRLHVRGPAVDFHAKVAKDGLQRLGLPLGVDERRREVRVLLASRGVREDLD